MKKALLIFIWAPFVSFAQNAPRFENDTVYTTSGYKIYIGQTLQFGRSTGKTKFNYVDIKNGVSPHSLENNTVTVKEIRDFGISSQKYNYVDILGSITYRDESKGYILFRLWFEQAIGYSATIPAELIVPKEFMPTIATTINDLSSPPRFERDTLYTSCGYKIYKGSILQFGKATRNGEFQYVNIKNNVPHLMLQYHSVRVKEIKDFGISVLGNGYITINGTILVNNSERGDIVIHLAFDHAIENIPGIPSELVVPEKFRNRLKTDPSQEIERLNKLYVYGTISHEQFEAAKKKLLAQ